MNPTAKTTPGNLFQRIAETTFYQPRPEDDAALYILISQQLIQPIQQGKLRGYALTLTGYFSLDIPVFAALLAA